MGMCTTDNNARAAQRAVSVSRISPTISSPSLSWRLLSFVLSLHRVSVSFFFFVCLLRFSYSLPKTCLGNCLCVCCFIISSLFVFSVRRETQRSTCSGCHAGWLPSPPGAICFCLSPRQGRLERLLVRGRPQRTRKPQSKTAVGG